MASLLYLTTTAVLLLHGLFAFQAAAEEVCFKGPDGEPVCRQGGSKMLQMRAGGKLKDEPKEEPERIDWIVMVADGCTDMDVINQVMHLPDGVSLHHRGHPSEGGLCYFIITGTEEEVHRAVEAHGWPGEVIIEPDSPTELIGEVPLPEGMEEGMEGDNFGNMGFGSMDFGMGDMGGEGMDDMGEDMGMDDMGGENMGMELLQGGKKENDTSVQTKKKKSAAPGDIDLSDRMKIPRTAATQKLVPGWGLRRISTRTMESRMALNPMVGLLGGGGVHVYIFDTGVRVDHEEFGGRAVPTMELDAKGDAVDCAAKKGSPCAEDKQGHGTHAAAFIGGRTLGVAPKVTIHAVKAFSDDGKGTESGGLVAIDWVLERLPKLGQPAIFHFSGRCKADSQAEMAAINKVVKDNGVTVVVPAGDIPLGASLNGASADSCESPLASLSSVITVGATMIAKLPTGNLVDGAYSKVGQCVDIFAPGFILFTASHKDKSSLAMPCGSPSASAITAGAAALLLSEQPKMTPAQLKSKLLDRSTKDGLAFPRRLAHLAAATPQRLVYVGKQQ